MGMFTKAVFVSQADHPTAANSVLIGPVDIKNYDKFSITYRNRHTTNAFVDMVVQVAADPSGTAANEPPCWVTLSTATLEVPSALGATAVALSSRVDNCWNYLRVLGRMANSGTSCLQIHITGFTKSV